MSGRTIVYAPVVSVTVVHSGRGFPPIFAKATVIPATPAFDPKSRTRPDNRNGPRGIAWPDDGPAGKRVSQPSADASMTIPNVATNTTTASLNVPLRPSIDFQPAAPAAESRNGRFTMMLSPAS